MSQPHESATPQQLEEVISQTLESISLRNEPIAVTIQSESSSALSESIPLSSLETQSSSTLEELKEREIKLEAQQEMLERRQHQLEERETRHEQFILQQLQHSVEKEPEKETTTTQPSSLLNEPPQTSPEPELEVKHAADTGNPLIDSARSISQGYTPSNPQIIGTLEKTATALLQEQGDANLTRDEKKTARDAAQVLEDVREIITEKNKDELIQRFVEFARLAIREASQQVSAVTEDVESLKHLKAEAKVTAQEVQSTAKDAVSSMRNLVLSLIRSSEFRNFLLESIQLVQEMAGLENEDLKSTLPDLKQMNTATLIETAQVASEGVKDIISGAPVSSRLQKHREKLKTLLRTMAYNREFKKSIKGLIQIISEMNSFSTELAKKTPGGYQLFKSDNVRGMWETGRDLIGRLAGESAFNSFLDSVWKFSQSVQQDESAQACFVDMRKFVMKVLDNPYKLDDDKQIQKGEELITRVLNVLYSAEHADLFNHLIHNLKVTLEAIKEDPATQKLLDDLTTFAHDVILDSSGKPDLRITTNFLNQVRHLMLPVLKEQFKTIPIPLIQGSTSKHDYRIENLNLFGKDLIPENVIIRAKSEYDLNVSKSAPESFQHTLATVKLVVRKWEAHARNFRFYFNRKVFPTITDEGVADLDIYGDSNKFTAKWKLQVINIGNAARAEFSLPKVHCYLEHFDVHLKSSSHPWLNRFLMAIFHNVMTRQIEKQVEQSFANLLLSLNSQLNQLLQQQGY